VTGDTAVEAWGKWNLRAEAVFQAAVAIGLATQERKAERPKGSKPTGHRIVCTPQRRPQESLKVRRLRKLSRILDDAVRKGAKVEEGLPQQALRSWHAAASDKVVSTIEVPASISCARQQLAQGVEEATRLETKKAVTEWKAKFAIWSLEALRAGAKVIADIATPLTFSAVDMREEWSKYWCPAEPVEGKDETWRSLAQEAGMARQEQAPWTPPTPEEFAHLLQKAKGAAGLDGWDAEEAQAMATHLPWLIEELCETMTKLVRETAAGAGNQGGLFLFKGGGDPEAWLR
jgi:hypothetical protein